MGVRQIGKSLIIANGIYTQKQLIQLIKHCRNLLITSYRNDEGSLPLAFRSDLLKETRMLVKIAFDNGIKHPEVLKTARVLGFEEFAL